MVKLKWKVSEPPTGRYRSFEKRSWPSAFYAGIDKPAAYILCDDAYRPAQVRDGSHGPLTVMIAEYSGLSFRWRKASKKCATLEEAKKLAVDLLNKYPEFQPKTNPTKETN